MNTKLTSIAIALIATSASAFAVDASAAGKTRAEVRAELEQAYAQGQLNQNAEFVDYPAAASTKSRQQVRAEAQKPGTPSVEQGSTSGKTRAEVRAELEQAYAQGQLNQNAEFVDQPAIASTKSRDEVRDEAVRAARAARGTSASSGS
jgi:predicted RNase H-like HicB family nuclease